MTPQDLIHAFETLAEAPDGVTRLRELVLELAVRGKLVPQDPEDEPASVLLERIAEEKAGLVKGKNIRKDKARPPDGEMPFELPEGWAWTCFDDVCDIGSGVTKGRKLAGRKTVAFPYLRVANVQAGRLDLGVMKEIEIPPEELAQYALEDGDVLLTEGGDWDKLGRSAIWGSQIPNCIHQNHVFRARSIRKDLVLPRWLSMFTNGPDGRAYFQSCAKQTTNLASINMTQLRGCPVPLPPLPEQHRIVERVDQLMGLLDRLEAARDARESTRAALRAAALAALRDADTPDEVQQAWDRIAHNIHDLFTDPADIEPLRQAVLQLAVRGRLVAQDPGDEPASVLLQRIAEEKARLVKEGKASKEKALPSTNGEWFFEVPENWSWTRFDEVCDIGSGVTKGRNLAGRETVAFPYLRVANVQAGHLDLAVMKEIEIPPEELPRYALESGDVLLTEGGDWDKLGRSAIWRDEIPNCIHQNHVFRARSIRKELVLPQWLSMLTNGPDGRIYFQSCAKQTTNLASINKTQLRSTPTNPSWRAQSEHATSGFCLTECRLTSRVRRYLPLQGDGDRLSADLSGATGRNRHRSP